MSEWYESDEAHENLRRAKAALEKQDRERLERLEVERADLIGLLRKAQPLLHELLDWQEQPANDGREGAQDEYDSTFEITVAIDALLAREGKP